jgi:hypothetical protein
MTMVEVEYRTPNGLHDAYLRGFSVDYEKATLQLEIDWLVDVPKKNSLDPEPIWKRGTLLIRGLEYFVIEPPRNGLRTFSDYAPDQMHGYATTSDDVVSKGLPDVSGDAFRHSIYLGYWESFIHIAGALAEVSPTELLVREMGEG